MTDNTKTLYNALDKIEELEEKNKRLTELLNHSNVRLAEEQLKNAELEKEKYELLGLIQAKDNLIEKIKCCYNCKFNFKFADVPCDDCEDYSKWEFAK